MVQSKLEVLKTKLAAAQKLVAQLERTIESQEVAGNIEPQGTVEFVYGRGDTKHTVRGVVHGVGALANGVEYVAVLVGEGVETQMRRVPLISITAYAAPGQKLPDTTAHPTTPDDPATSHAPQEPDTQGQPAPADPLEGV